MSDAQDAGQRRLVLGFLAGVLVLYVVQDRVRVWLHARAEERLVKAQSVALGSARPVESVEDIEAISRIADEVARTWRPGNPVRPEVADKLAAYMQPDRPVPTRMRAMKFGQVIGEERFKKLLLEAWKDPDARVRRTAVAKADTVPSLTPEMVPSLAGDPDPGVRAAWDYWLIQVKSRRR